MNRTAIGLVILGVVAAVAIAITQFDVGGLLKQAKGRDPVTVSLFYGGEKSALLANPQVAAIIRDRYSITLDATRAGSIEMATTLDTRGKDCLWPSNEVAVELARKSGKTVLAEQTIFNSPIVFYAWSDVADALVKAGAVTAATDGMLTADVNRIGQLITDEKRWKEDLGLNIYGTFKVISTDPEKSNSGNIWAALLATSFNGGAPPTEADMGRILPQVEGYFARQGFMESSSGDLFEAFLKQGMGARPIIVGYENQLVEFVKENAQAAGLINSKIKVIYPEPTIFASHPLISLTPACKRLAEALVDPDLQKRAWADHGFRTGLIGIENDPAAQGVVRLPETVSQVVPMPSAQVIETILDGLQG